MPERFRELKDKIFKLISNDIGIDLGTANTLVYLSGQGVIINEPSVVAINQKTERVVAIGKNAKEMLGRTPAHIEAVRPLIDGVISNFEVTEEMLAYFINKAQEQAGWRLLGPRVVIGVPSGITNVERRAVRDAARNAGAREVHIIEEPMAAALGTRLPVHEPVGTMIVDIGGGTSDVAVISLGGIVESRNLRIAGDKLNEDVISYIKDEFKILLGEKTAEEIKLAIGSVAENDEPLEFAVKGRDLVTGLPREIILTDADIKEAVGGSVNEIVATVREVLETTPPEIVSDVMRRGIVLAGGGALLTGLRVLLEEDVKIPVHIAEDPLTCVVRGTGVVLEDMDKHKEVLLAYEDELSPQ